MKTKIFMLVVFMFFVSCYNGSDNQVSQGGGIVPGPKSVPIIEGTDEQEIVSSPEISVFLADPNPVLLNGVTRIIWRTRFAYRCWINTDYTGSGIPVDGWIEVDRQGSILLRVKYERWIYFRARNQNGDSIAAFWIYTK